MIPGQSPGESRKVSYMQEVVIQGIPTGIIYGSGIYPADSSDGCAVAAAGSTARSAGLNLFAAMSFLFLAISFKRRSA